MIMFLMCLWKDVYFVEALCNNNEVLVTLNHQKVFLNEWNLEVYAIS